jgi:hypothetical protein
LDPHSAKKNLALTALFLAMGKLLGEMGFAIIVSISNPK